jgi:hypothetical protein
MPVGRRAALAKVALALVAVVASLLVMEVALRHASPLRRFVSPLRSFHRFDPQVGWRGRAGVDQRYVSGTGDFDVRIRHDAGGFRLHEAPAAPAGAPEWAFLGDSFTWGSGVDQGECFTDRLQGLVGDRATVRNCGTNGTSTLQQALLLEDLVREGFRPQRVVVMMFHNDFLECMQAAPDKPYLVIEGGAIVMRNHPVLDSYFREGWWGPFRRASALCSTVAYAADMWRRRLSDGWSSFKGLLRGDGWTAAPRMQVGAPQAVTPEQRLAVSHALQRIRRTCDGIGAECCVALVPLPPELVASEPTPVQVAGAELSAEHGMRWIDLTPEIREASAGDPLTLYFPRDGHWTSEGHRAAAEGLRKALAP